MWLMTPLFMMFLMLIITGFSLLGVIWLDKFPKVDANYKHPFWKGIRGIIFMVFTYWAILLLDSIVKILFLGELGYGNINYHITPLIFGIIISTVIIMGCVFNAPTIKTLLAFVGISIYSIYYLEVLIEVGESGEMDAFFAPLLGNLYILLGINLVFFGYEKITGKRFKPLWNYSSRFKEIFDIKFYIVICLLVATEVILRCEGWSLLFWLS